VLGEFWRGLFLGKSLQRGLFFFFKLLKLEGQFNLIGPISMALGEPTSKPILVGY
jgi:hypothetical protein